MNREIIYRLKANINAIQLIYDNPENKLDEKSRNLLTLTVIGNELLIEKLRKEETKTKK